MFVLLTFPYLIFIFPFCCPYILAVRYDLSIKFHLFGFCSNKMKSCSPYWRVPGRTQFFTLFTRIWIRERNGQIGEIPSTSFHGLINITVIRNNNFSILFHLTLHCSQFYSDLPSTLYSNVLLPYIIFCNSGYSTSCTNPWLSYSLFLVPSHFCNAFLLHSPTYTSSPCT